MVHLDLSSMSQRRFFLGHDGPISCFDVSLKYLASTQSDQLFLWDFYSTRILAKIKMSQVDRVA